jgi:hypothetical protein
MRGCPLVCSIAPPADPPGCYSQKRDLVQTKAKFPEYGDIYSGVLQDCIELMCIQFARCLFSLLRYDTKLFGLLHLRLWLIGGIVALVEWS